MKQEKSDNPQFIKKIAKTIGMILSAIAIVYVIRKILSFDVSFSDFIGVRSFVIVGLLCILQTAKLFTACYAWKCYISFFSHIDLKYREVVLVYLKSNILKYVPGNVLQYIGRNELAIRRNIPHMKVALATFFDVGTNLFISVVATILLLRNDVIMLFEKYVSFPDYAVWILLGIAFTLLLALFFFLKKNGISKRVRRELSLIKKKDFLYILKAVGYYSVMFFFSEIPFLIICIYVTGMILDVNNMLILVGANEFSWIIGFITPGASGGIGVRESIMLLLLNGIVDGGKLAAALVISRIVGIIGDVFAFILAKLMEWKIDRGEEMV